ncbi:MAG: YjjW family glycine radical enzyme activase [Clostridia bacterium]|nr:YjjW family glycine radical enzyme activase [Clostridia bacterium]
MKRAPVNRIIPFSNVDGPGNRTSIFFQGCTFHCLFCHNPETIHLCNNCGKCVGTCPVSALSMEDGKVIWDMNRCVTCDACIKTCENFASPRVRWMSVPEVMGEIRRTAPYIGGITTSGGECTIYHEFLTELYAEVQKLGLTALIDSNGSLDFSRHPELLAVADGVMLDVKAVTPEWNDYLISHSRDLVLKNLDYLLAAGKLQEVRTIIFPDREEENAATVRYVAEHIKDKCPYKIIRYRPFGVREHEQDILGHMTTEEEEAERFANLARNLGATRAFVV